MNTAESAAFALILGVLLTIVGLALNLLQIPDAWRFLGIASDAAIRSDARELSIAYVIETITRALGKGLVLLTMGLLAARVTGLIDSAMGVLTIYLLDLSLFLFDCASAATIWARRAVRLANQEQAQGIRK